ncbi:MAG: hypothetical protein K9G76_12370 [Bacteroidales bacterium]|nr:hypothetical protein [Bacteroidales bacterium]MCF8405324.1 hypothetical protein [Bacteroidales bacterium]
MPVQLKTLIPLFTAFILIFLVVRHFLIPESFGKEGHYRYDAIAMNADKPLNYAGKDACAECHDDQVLAMESDMHANLSCEVCHGPGLAHYDNPDSARLIIPDQREHCGLCHSYNANRVDKITQIDLNDHNVEEKCIHCHNPHVPWEIAEETSPEENL